MHNGETLRIDTAQGKDHLSSSECHMHTHNWCRPAACTCVRLQWAPEGSASLEGSAERAVMKAVAVAKVAAEAVAAAATPCSS